MTRQLPHIAGRRGTLTALLAMLLVLLSGILGFSNPTSAFASDDVSSYVTGISTNAEVYESYSTAECTLSFSVGSGNQLRPGDTISASWSPTTGTTYATGFSTNIDVILSEYDVTIGTATVTGEGITITFNDNADDYQNVSGNVTFSLKVVNTGTEDGTVEISSGSHSTSITVRPKTLSTPSPVYKTGEWRTDGSNLVDWAFRVDRSNDFTFTSDVVIEDPIPSGLTYKGITEVSVYEAGAEGEGPEKVFSEDKPEDIDELMSDLHITASCVNNTLKVTIPKDTANSYYIIYFQFSTSVSDSSLLDTSVTNKAKATYNSNSFDISETLTPPSSGSGSDADRLGAISVLKEVKGTTVPIPGVTFNVYKLSGKGGSRVSAWYDDDGDGTGDEDHATITTDASGAAMLEGLTDGYYELEEVSGPSWVVLSGQSYVVLVGSSTTTVTIGNSIKTTDVSITKRWDDDSDAAGARPSAEEFASWLTLKADGETVEGSTPTVVDNGDNTYTVTYGDVNAYDSQGNEITYTVVESIPSEYGRYASASSSVSVGGTLVNTYVPDGDGGTSDGDGGSSTEDGDESGEDSGASGRGTESDGASDEPKPTVIPVTGDATPSVLVLALVAGTLVASSLCLRKRAR